MVGDVVEEKIEQKVGKIVEEKLEQKLEEKLKPLYQRIDRIPDEMIQIFNDGFEALVSRRLNDVEETAENHEKRLKKLEKSSFI